MNKLIKKMTVILMVGMLLVGTLTGCTKKEEPKDLTPANAFLESFKTQIEKEKDLEKVASNICPKADWAHLCNVVMPVEEGYLNGFENEIKGFEEGVVFSPMIGSIPFIGYIFKTSDADALMATLKESAMLNWNICVVADEMVVEKVGDYVFFCMAPATIEE